jgi:hypothetical protein
MTTLSWFPEPFQAYGSFVGEGARKVLGKPRLDPLSVLVRETVQNSWDAKRSDRETVDFAMDCWRLKDEQLQAMRHEIFTGLPPEGILLGQVLDREEVSALVISDRGTVGLSGPVRADHPVAGRSDFIDLVFNMGQPRDIAGGGGTYGFGKTISYVISEASTCILYTRTRVEAELQSRLIAVAVGRQYATDARRFTGRHWWGVASKDRVEPLTGNHADQLARALGFPTFEEQDTGLSILIVAPRFDDSTPRQSMNFLANSLTWNFWPKMVGAVSGGRAPMTFRVSLDGEPIAIPDPTRHPPLGGYVKAFRGLHAYEAGLDIDPDVDVVPVRGQRPNRQLGLLALTRVAREPRVDVDDGADPDAAGGSALFTGNSHHVALMRRVELVVKYLDGPELPAPHVEWAGVFMNDEDIDSAFANAEPPTHDDWQAHMVEDKSQRRLVNVALKNINAELRRRFASTPTAPTSNGQNSGVVIGNALGGLIAGASGTGPSKTTAAGSTAGWDATGNTRAGGATSKATGGGGGDGGTGSPAGSRPFVREMATQPAMVGGSYGAEVYLSVETHGQPVQVVGSVAAAIDREATEHEPPLGAAVPQIVGWRRPDEAPVSVAGARLTIEQGETDAWVLVVRNPARTAIAVEVKIAETKASA